MSDCFTFCDRWPASFLEDSRSFSLSLIFWHFTSMSIGVDLFHFVFKCILFRPSRYIQSEDFSFRKFFSLISLTVTSAPFFWFFPSGTLKRWVEDLLSLQCVFLTFHFFIPMCGFLGDFPPSFPCIHLDIWPTYWVLLINKEKSEHCLPGLLTGKVETAASYCVLLCSQWRWGERGPARAALVLLSQISMTPLCLSHPGSLLPTPRWDKYLVLPEPLWQDPSHTS